MAVHLIDAADIVDDLIKPTMVSEKILADVDEYIADVARDNDTDPTNIADPLPYKVKALAIAQACVLVCKTKAGTGPRDANGDDNFQKKLKIFQADVNRLVGQIDGLILIGGARYGSKAGQISIGRA